MKRHHGFTFIELMIVASIIILLAAIAIPNFLAAQIRAKVSRVKAEQEMMMIALQSYFVDKTNYPVNRLAGIPSDVDLIPLTTPIAYMVNLPRDLFRTTDFQNVKLAQPYLITNKNKKDKINIQFGGYGYISYLKMVNKKGEVTPARPLDINTWYCLMSPGPNYLLDYDATATPNTYIIYDPTNGTTSGGDLYTFGPQ